MGMLALRRLMAAQRDRRRRRKAQARNGAITSMAKRKGTFLRGGDSSQGAKRLRYSGPYLTEDIWRHIHSLMPLRDAARAACVSQAFLRSWRRYPNLILTTETLGLEQKKHWKVHMARYFTRVDHILKNHSGIGVKRFQLVCGRRKLICRLNNWLQIAISSGIEEITLSLPSEYSFPCSLLSGGSGRSLQHLELVNCAFRPMAGLGCSRNLTKLHLHSVLITDDELACFLSECFALKHLDLSYCRELVYLKIPCLLEQLSYLNVDLCHLQMIESKAPNLSSLIYSGNLIELSLGQSSQVKTLDINFYDKTNFLCYVITKLQNIVPNLESLTIYSDDERINTPMVDAKFLHLKYLEIYFDGLDGSDEAFPPEYDYLSLVSVLHASPVLDTFILSVQQGGMKHDSVSGDTTTNLRTMPGHKHERLKEVMIIGFCSATSMVELTCHILENTTSLETITLDTVCDVDDLENIGRCCTTTIRKTGSCYPLRREMILEAHRGVMAIERYIKGKVPSNVELTVREPCTWCHDLERLDALEKENGSHYSPPHLKLEDISLLLKPV
ncbi:uncharacterized protein LOC127774573 [Oryza glaberrima]|uniref:uncharacterized protein LOC127774573 n=1 Tax=Oryza glaberrima TaxID=4538 RepID=UPI00224C35E1|nr:uncharacterized protein LOC127774573 [Oryza glaberrima]